MVNTKPAAVVSGKDPKPQTALFNKARNDLFKRGNDVHAVLKIKVRVSLWYNGEMYEYASAADVCSSALGKVWTIVGELWKWKGPEWEDALSILHKTYSQAAHQICISFEGGDEPVWIV
ncbi:hypothetical protein F5883DRAFT_620741 [Diaporthe sp. PMI_573]|nr:hypothetical protein F5883DRAFT_620741 [Diaporthaceae sp. PMI_573]